VQPGPSVLVFVFYPSYRGFKFVSIIALAARPRVVTGSIRICRQVAFSERVFNDTKDFTRFSLHHVGCWVHKSLVTRLFYFPPQDLVCLSRLLRYFLLLLLLNSIGLFGIVFLVNFMDCLFYSIMLVFNLLCQCPPFDLGMADVLAK